MARKRMRRRRDDSPSTDLMTNPGHNSQPVMIDGKMVHIRQIRNTDEGVLYSHSITVRRKQKRRTTILKSMRSLFSIAEDDASRSLGSIRSGLSDCKQPHSLGPRNFQAWVKHATSKKSIKQYTIKPRKRFESSVLNWMSRMNCPFVNSCSGHNPDAHNYRPGQLLFSYINWTFTGMWSEVVLTFVFIYFVVMLIFTLFLWIAGNAQPACIVAAGAPFGDNDTEDTTRFSDAFALSWTTFTTVGYGMIYTAVGGDFQPNGPGGKLETEPHRCSWVVTLCTVEAFLGLLYAGMCAAILFGKVNRVQSHANIMFSNSVCLQYEEVEEDNDDDDEEEGMSGPVPPPMTSILTLKESKGLQIGSGNGEEGEEKNSKERGGGKVKTSILDDSFVSIDEENPMTADSNLAQAPQAELGVGEEENKERANDAFIDQFNGCPVLKFQIVNEQCNRQGAEIVDAIMKVVGIKFKGSGRVTRSEYVRVNLVDYEHPFLSRVWHGVHILDCTSPLLTDKARQRIRENNGSWPSHWFRPDVIRQKLEFNDLVVTVAGISNISALTVHAYKRYKIGDVLIGYNFAPLVFRDKESGMLEVDKTLVNDVREQAGLQGEDLSVRRLNDASKHSRHSKHDVEASTIRIKKSKSFSHHLE